MKIRFFAALLVAALSVTCFTGCAVPTKPQLEAAEEKIENRLDRAENAIENQLDAAEEIIVDTLVPAAAAPAVSVAEPTLPAANTPSQHNRITKEEAIAIALKDAGFTADQVTRIRAEFDYDDGTPEYEVDFHQGAYEYDYEIHAETGVILQKDIDRAD